MVGVDHGGVERIDEYTPTRDARRRAAAASTPIATCSSTS